MPPSINFELCCLKRKLKQKEEQFIHSQSGSINRFIVKQILEYHCNEESVTKEHREEEVELCVQKK